MTGWFWYAVGAAVLYTLATFRRAEIVDVVTAKTQYSLKNAQEYFEEHLCVGDYYDEGQRVSGEWVGLGAERLGLAGKGLGDQADKLADEYLRLAEQNASAVVVSQT